MIKVLDNKIKEISLPYSNLNVLMINKNKIGHGNYDKWIAMGSELLADTIMYLIFNQVITIRHQVDDKNFIFRFLKYKTHNYYMELDFVKLKDCKIGWLEQKIVDILAESLKVSKGNYQYKKLIVDTFDFLLGKNEEHHSPGAKLYEKVVVNDDRNWIHEYHSYLSIINFHELRFKSKFENNDIVNKQFHLFKNEIERLKESDSEIERFINKLTKKIELEINSRKTPDSD